MNPATQTVLGQNMIIPYDGYLMVDSSPISGTRDMIFRLYDEADNELWSETVTVQLFSGRFSVGLGSSTNLTTTILDAEQLYLGMSVLETDAQGVTTEIALSGKQAIEPAPFAAWAANSSDFAVAGDLTVARDATVTQDLSVEGSLDVDGRLTLGASDATALFENTSNELYISPNLGHPGGVYVGNDFQTNYDAQLGSSTSASNTTIVGTDNNGTTAALLIQSAFGQEMLIDGNELDSNGALLIQANSLEATRIDGDLEVRGDVTLGDDTTDTVTINGPDNNGATAPLTIVDNTFGQTMRLDGNEIDSDQDLFIQQNTSNGIYLQSDTQVSGSLTVTEDITITGDITNLTYSTEYRVSHANTDGINSQTGDLCLNRNGSSNPTDTCTPNTAGSALYLADNDNTICFLTAVGFQDVDGDDERGFCSVYSTGGKWYLAASAETNDADVFCNARCLAW